MKFVVTFRERRADPGSTATQRRAARPTNQRAVPETLAVLALVERVCGGGGYAIVETDAAADLQHLAALFPACDCRVEPVVAMAFDGGRRPRPASRSSAPGTASRLPEMPAGEPHEGAFSDDDVYDTED